MGSQVNFFMVPEDEEEFCRFVLTDPAVMILRACHLEQPHVPVAPPLPAADQPYCAGLVFWNSDVASKEEITPRNKVRAVGCPGGVYGLSAIVYPVIDFNRSVPQPNGLAPGRIWAEFNRYDVPEDRLKLARSWFRRLARWLNKWPYRWGFYRIGPKTKEYLDKGGMFVNFVPGEIISVKEIGSDKVIERSVQEQSFRPEVEQDDGKSDLTFDIRPE